MTRNTSFYKILNTFGLFGSLLLLVVSFQNCSSSHSDTADQGLSHAQRVAQLEGSAKAVFANRCYECHNPTLDPVNDKIEDILNIDSLLADGFVAPGEPQNSSLYLAMVDGLMPHDGSELSDSDIETVRDWIIAMGDPMGTGGVIFPPDDGGGGGGTTEPTFTNINAIIAARCVSCHGPARQDSGLRLDGYANIMGQVNVNNPASSPIYAQLNSNTARMPPPPSSPVASSDRQLILQWIRDGALNN